MRLSEQFLLVRVDLLKLTAPKLKTTKLLACACAARQGILIDQKFYNIYTLYAVLRIEVYDLKQFFIYNDNMWCEKITLTRPMRDNLMDGMELSF